MITIIVPVYNVEPYLPQCLDSILAQTYKDLEILLIDDGSTDRCGEICDQYAARDPRICVFHTENRGLSAARNLGLDHAQGDYIGFVDSDDWIEPDMYECLLRRAEETGADIVECGVFKDYSGVVFERRRKNVILSGKEAVYALIHGKLSSGVMNKLWKSHCFEDIRFPEGRVYEDIATTYRLYLIANYVSGADAMKYHYISREGSITTTNTMSNLCDLWYAQRDRYEQLRDKMDDESRQIMLRLCAKAIIKVWVYYYASLKKEREIKREVLCEMNSFTKRTYPLLGYKEWCPKLRIGIIFPHFNNPLSFFLAWMAFKIFN